MKPQPNERRNPTGHLWLGLMVLGCFAIHATERTIAGRPDNLLWACHMAALSVGLGVLLRSPTLTAVGTLLLMVGIPSWLLSLLEGGAFYPTSVFTHVGGFAGGVMGLRWQRCYPRRAVCSALIFIGILLVASRLLTPATFNVNMAHAPWGCMKGFIDQWHYHMVFVLAMWTLLLVISDLLLRRAIYWRLPKFSGQSLRSATSG